MGRLLGLSVVLLDSTRAVSLADCPRQRDPAPCKFSLSELHDMQNLPQAGPGEPRRDEARYVLEGIVRPIRDVLASSLAHRPRADVVSRAGAIRSSPDLDSQQASSRPPSGPPH